LCKKSVARRLRHLKSALNDFVGAPHVDAQTNPLRESRRAEGALQRLLLVNVPVFYQGVGIGKGLLADLAHLIADVEMGLHVVLKVALGQEVLGAHVALEGPDLGVHRRHVGGHLNFLLE